uniref:Suppressor of fused C-terminal domain-containing protein n=1 Tax=Glossina austeni TaxID=7395 RepID=A0A1A9VIR1_GLOAU
MCDWVIHWEENGQLKTLSVLPSRSTSISFVSSSSTVLVASSSEDESTSADTYVLIPDDLVPRMIKDFQDANLEIGVENEQRLEFRWPDKCVRTQSSPSFWAHGFSAPGEGKGVLG